MIFNLGEFVDMIIMTAVLGFIFKDIFKPARTREMDPLDYYKNFKSQNFEDFKYAIMLTAPAVILHEFGHKFVAMSFGLTATFGTSYTWLGLALILKLMNFGFIFLVPAFVSISGITSNPIAMPLIAFAGPAVNLILWVGAKLLIDTKKLPRKYLQFAVLTRKINGFLFVFNMIPIPPFDGFKVLMGIVGLFGF